MGAQIRTDNLPYKILIPVFRFYVPGTCSIQITSAQSTLFQGKHFYKLRQAKRSPWAGFEHTPTSRWQLPEDRSRCRNSFAQQVAWRPGDSRVVTIRAWGKHLPRACPSTGKYLHTRLCQECLCEPNIWRETPAKCRLTEPFLAKTSEQMAEECRCAVANFLLCSIKFLQA